MPDLPVKPITIAILAMGGQGGGVLADWIVALAERNHWQAQATSVPGVAQRTGATIYYLELLPKDVAAPIMALMPVPGDVDIVLAAELIEAGRGIQRGLVTPDRTVLIASAHRALAVQEKSAPGDGTVDSGKIIAAGHAAAKRFLYFDMAEIAEQSGSVISAVLFGALAGADALPFPSEAYKETIRAGGVGVEASLRAFAAGADRTRQPSGLTTLGKSLPVLPVSTAHTQLDALLSRLRKEFQPPTHDMLFAGLSRVVDFQDPAYGAEYLDHMVALRALDNEEDGYALTIEAAKQLAVAMCYDDVIRVADLKTRASRFARVRNEVRATEDQLVYTTEFMHPRAEEVCGTLPASWGRAIENSPRLFRLLSRMIDRGRRVRTGNIGWFLTLYLLAGMRRFRRSTLRHDRESEHIAAWLALIQRFAPGNYALAVEIAKCRRLVKGYSDTLARGHGKFDKVIAAAIGVSARPDAADWVRRLRDAALADEDGTMLDGAIKTVATL